MTVQTEVRSLVVPVVAGAGLGVFSLLADGVIGGRRANDINDLIECYRRVRRGMVDDPSAPTDVGCLRRFMRPDSSGKAAAPPSWDAWAIR